MRGHVWSARAFVALCAPLLCLHVAQHTVRAEAHGSGWTTAASAPVRVPAQGQGHNGLSWLRPVHTPMHTRTHTQPLHTSISRSRSTARTPMTAYLSAVGLFSAGATARVLAHDWRELMRARWGKEIVRNTRTNTDDHHHSNNNNHHLNNNNGQQVAHSYTQALPAYPKPPNSAPRILEYIVMSDNGTITTRHTAKPDLASQLGCPVRDLRVIDSSFPFTCVAFLARVSGVVLCVDRVKAIVKADEVMLFDPHSKIMEQLVPLLQCQVASGYTSYACETPFEHIVLEAILSHACHGLRERLQQLAPPILRILGDLRFRHGTLSSFNRLLDELLPLRNRLAELQYLVQEMRKGINDVLISDEDMATMYLTSAEETGEERKVEHHREIELLFENYLMQVEWCDAEIREIQQAIKNTEDTVQMQLDLLRNKILRVELLMNVVQAVVGFGGLVTGVFGMNLLSGLEANPRAFYRVATAIIGSMVAMVGAATWYGSRSKFL